jgi:hypothetical protein
LYNQLFVWTRNKNRGKLFNAQ